MAYRLRMPAEIGDWLTELAGSAPEAAAEVGAGLLALMSAQEIPGPPLVIDPDEPASGLLDPRESLDVAYQQLLESLQVVRREIAEIATERAEIMLTLAGPDLDPEMRAALERQLAAAQELESVLSRRGHRLQALVDAFRVQKETAKAMTTAAEAQARVQEAIAGLEPAPGTEPESGDIDKAAADWAEQAGRLQSKAMRLLGIIRDPAGAAPDHGSDRSESDVLELRPDPLGSDLRVLFAEEPTGTLTLLTVLEDSEAVDEHRDTAISLARELLEHIRDEGWLTESLQFEDGDALVTRYFAGRGPDVAARAARLGTAATLASLREGAGLTEAELAQRADLDDSIVALIDRHGARHADVEAIAAYARALGGTLRLTIALDGTEHRVS